MIKVIVTGAVISKGYEDAPALRFNETENGKSVRFKVGVKVYDKKAESKSRWFNIGVKAFGGLSERIKNMKLDSGSFVNLIGKLDEDQWTDQSTGENRSAMVIIVEDIEYSGGGGEKNGKQNGGSSGQASGSPASNGAPPPQGGFTGFESFGGGNSYFPEE
jgi:single-stranded DNA-binding protein